MKGLDDGGSQAARDAVQPAGVTAWSRLRSVWGVGHGAPGTT